MDIQWYPGHMTKARRNMQESLKLIDIVIELLDARLPISSRNPDIDQLTAGKARLIILNKADMADEQVNKLWADYFSEMDTSVLMMDSRKRNHMNRILMAVNDACRDKMCRDRRRGIKNRPLRAMIAGIPNVGKSTFINTFAGRAGARTGNKPGVTRGNQWIKAGKNLEMLDTPGLLWPKFDDRLTGIRLAVSGSVNDDIVDIPELALWLSQYLIMYYPGVVEERYGVVSEGRSPEDIIREIAWAKNCVGKGGQADYDRASKMLIDDFRSLRLGRISLERP